MLTLERSIGTSFGNDTELRQSGAFAAEVFPDLPVATTWSNLMKMGMLSRQAHEQDEAQEVASPGTTKVATVAVNLRSMKEVERRIVRSASDGGDAAGQQAAGALLFVSGSHPLRGLPGVSRLLPSSITALKLATQLRGQGSIPADTQLWAVANPNTEPDASLLEAKVASGARVILTQPTFDLDAFHSWMDDASRRGLTSTAKILVGMPLLSSPANLAFWGSLAGCVGKPAFNQLLSSFQDAKSKGDLAAYSRAYNVQLVQQLLAKPGVSGMHVMPISPASRRMALEFVREGVLQGKA